MWLLYFKSCWEIFSLLQDYVTFDIFFWKCNDFFKKYIYIYLNFGLILDSTPQKEWGRNPNCFFPNHLPCMSRKSYLSPLKCRLCGMLNPGLPVGCSRLSPQLVWAPLTSPPRSGGLSPLPTPAGSFSFSTSGGHIYFPHPDRFCRKWDCLDL